MSDHEMEVDEEEKVNESIVVIQSRVFNEEKLPSSKDVLSRISIAYDDKLADENKSETLEFFIPTITQELLALWKKTSIPILTENGVALKMKRLLQKYRKIKMNRNRNKYKHFIGECEELFDIARCKCTSNGCKCSEDDKIPNEFIDFIVDQRGDRRLRLSEFCDSISLLNFVTIENEPTATSTTQQATDTSSSDYIPSMSSSEGFLNGQNTRIYNARRPMPNLAAECDRYGVSDRLAAALVSAAFKDYGVAEEGQPVIIDKNKIGRERSANRRKLMEKRKCTGNIISFSFDGRTDKTIIQHRTDDGKLHPRMIKEKHITVLKQPYSQFLGYLADTSIPGSQLKAAQITAEHLINFFHERNLDLTYLVAVGSDGEVKNTGRHDGIVRTLEKTLGIPLHWFICLIHFIELCLRHMFETIDSSRTTGPGTATGTIRKAIEALEKMEGVDMPVSS